MRVGEVEETSPDTSLLPASYETAPDSTGMRVAVSFRWAGEGQGRFIEKVRLLVGLLQISAGGCC